MKKKNIHFEIEPKKLKPGDRWVTVRIKNKNKEPLENLNIRLNSTDTLGIKPLKDSKHASILKPEEEISLNFLIKFFTTAQIYLSIDGHHNKIPSYWESPPITIKSSERTAEILTVLATRKPQMIIGDVISTRTVIKFLKDTNTITLETWIQNPDNTIEEFETKTIKNKNKGDVDEHISKFSPEQKGIYKVTSELFKDNIRLDKQTDVLFVDET